VVTWEWGDYDYGPWSLEAVYRPAHAVWQRARTLQSTHGEVYFEPDAAIDPSGRAVVTYIREDAYSNIRPVYVRRHLDGARWTRRTAISSPRSNRSARAVVDRGGTITIVWQREGQTPGIEAARHRLGHPWTHPVRLDSGVSGDLQSVVDAAGSVTCVWTRWDASVHAARRPARGPWNKVRQIAPPASQTSVYTRVSLAVGIEGDLAVLWRHRGSRAVFRPRRGGWGQPLLVPLGTDTRPGSRLGPIGAIAGNGDTLIVWIAHGHLRARWHRAS
jgi:hypothetical protein